MIFQNCSNWKKNLIQKGNYEIAIENAVVDFCNTSSLVNKDKVFYINFKEYNSGIIGVTILGDVNKIYLLHGVPQSRIPEQYFEYHNKLFYWYDNKKSAHSNILKKLSDYKVVDSVSSITDEMGNIRDEKKKGMNYFFCKENLLIYRKEKTSIALPRDFKMDLDCK